MVVPLKHVIKGEDIEIIPGFKIHNPLLSEVADFGEEKYLQIVQQLLGKPQDMMVYFDDMGLDFEKISPFDFFVSNFLSIPKIIYGIDSAKHTEKYQDLEKLPEEERDYSIFTSILFGDVDISKFYMAQNVETEEVYLYHPQRGLALNKDNLFELQEYIRRINNIKDEKPRNFSSEFVKKTVIDFERSKMRRQQRQKKEFESLFADVIARLVNTEGFKYDYETVFDLHISQFYNALITLQGISEYENTISAVYAGTMSYEKMSDKSVLNWLRFSNR